MQLDSLALRRLVQEGAPLLIGGMIRDCHASIEGQGLVMGVAAPGGYRAMRFSMQRHHSRWHLIPKLPARQEAVENHLTLVARQKLVGGQITALSLEEGERIVRLDVERRDFTGSSEQYCFIAELMGPYSNLLVLDSFGIIAATWKIAHSYENLHREVRPGKPYLPPPPSGRYPMRALSEEEWSQFFHQQPVESLLQTALLQMFRGLTPGVIQAALSDLEWAKNTRIADVTDDLIPIWAAVIEDLWIEVQAGTRLPPWEDWIDLSLHGEALHFAFAEHYEEIERAESEGDRAQQWSTALKSRETELRKLRSKLYEELGAHYRALELRQLGDLIYGSLHLLPDRRLGYDTAVEVPDIFAEEPVLVGVDLDALSEEELERLTNPVRPLVTITIPGDKTALQLAQEAHRRASRGQRGIAEVERRLALVDREIDALDARALGWRQHLGLDAVRWKDLVANVRSGRDRPAALLGALDALGKKKGAEELIPQALKGLNLNVYQLPHDLIAFVGGNAMANEALWRYGSDDQIWLHTKGVPGSHVLIAASQGQVPAESLLVAARLAASHSSVKEGTKIPVDYVQVRYLKKPPGTPPGYVTYTRERTLLVDPFPALELRRRKV